jgi:mitochondrial carrier
MNEYYFPDYSIMSELDEEDKKQTVIFLQHSLSGLIFHPVEYVKVLCQLGHEPIPARLGRSLFGSPRMVLPNVFQYIKHIKKSDGLFGCFNGFLPTVVGNFASATLSLKIIRTLKLIPIDNSDPPLILTDDEPKKEEYIKYAKRELTLHTVSLVISYPFRVVSISMMASFVGKEEGYRTMFHAMKSIYSDKGLLGFYSGFVPRLIGDLSCIASSIFVAYYINKHFVKTKEARGYVFPSCLFITSSVTYPFLVVSTCMAVNGSSLVAGNPPHMPTYSSWIDCLQDLVSRKQHKRGSSLIFRFQP